MTGISQTSLRLSTAFAGLVLTLSVAAAVSAAIVGKSGLLDRGVIAFVSDCFYAPSGLFQLDVAHQIRHQLSEHYERIYSLSYSPYGSWLVFEAMERGAQSAFNRRVYAIDLEANREYLLAPDYISFNGTPLLWQPDGKHLELRMMGDIGTTLGVADLVVNVANGEVIDATPVADAFVTSEGSSGGVSATVVIPASGFNAAYTMNNRVDADTSADGQEVRSHMENGRFDLYIQVDRSTQPVRVTNDECIERYPRWQP